MFRSQQLAKIFRFIICLSPGGLLYGSSCASDIEDALVAAGLDFIEATAEDVLRTFIPISEILNLI